MRFRSFQLRNPRLCPREKVKLHGRHVVKVTFINVLASLTANCVDVQFSLFRVYLVGKKRLLIVSFSAFLSDARLGAGRSFSPPTKFFP